MLGPASLRNHLASKKHLHRQKRKAEGYEPVYLATGNKVQLGPATFRSNWQQQEGLGYVEPRSGLAIDRSLKSVCGNDNWHRSR